MFFYVVSSVTRQLEAVIAYGWESAEFYAKWVGDNDPAVTSDLKGPILNCGSPQSALAPQLLKFIRDVVLKDREYVQRLKTHYWMFRHYIDTKPKRKKKRRV
ncbi:MAG: hypothetical protein HY673_04855 [Chloroflexi bacterium]|nr:hypothetical protein [Chloroflexota bacterium]